MTSTDLMAADDTKLKPQQVEGGHGAGSGNVHTADTLNIEIHVTALSHCQ